MKRTALLLCTSLLATSVVACSSDDDENPPSGTTTGGSGGAAGSGGTGGTAGDGGGGVGGDAGGGGEPANVDSPLAINLAGVTYYSRQWTFVDQTKHGGGFGYAASPGAADEHGWILSGDVGLFLSTGLDGHYPGGAYVALYEGSADFSTLDTIWDAQGTPMDNDATLNQSQSAAGRVVLDVTPSNNGYVLSYDNISSSDHVRNLRIMPGQFEQTHATQIFHPTFLESIERFSTLRFMDMMRTNGSDQSAWEDRPLPTDALQGTSKGVALEYLIELSNRIHANPWFNIPHLATDDYVAQFARMVRDDLDPTLQVYVEYSNEVWNSGFEQYSYAEGQGVAAGLGQGRDAADRFYCRRSLEIFDIFETEFAATGRQGLVRVIASQNSPYWALRMMDWQDPQTGVRAVERADYWAVAPYFCGGPPDNPGSVDALLDVCEADIADTLANAKEIGDGARSYGVQLIAYEGGQHIRNDGAGTAAQAIYDQANDAARMGELYTTYLNQWRADGGQMFALFSLISGQSVYGRWGLLLAQDDFTYPKYAAAMSFITDNPVWW
ncbi:MAG: hypothetical protein JRI23_15900 [Deltaproteobacteria bacterium]|jgi:hypothetical protein|nr:hypothetical protein [Deltaproteobacteria bacterium]MBW2533248.1 hypothetical protein [Deltaproteobacteria bacterium]